jgi:hypothetical protein
MASGAPLFDLNVDIKLDRLQCHSTGSDPGSNAEPYLWIIYYKADGQSLTFNFQTQRLQSPITWRERVGGDDDIPFDGPDTDHHQGKPTNAGGTFVTKTRIDGPAVPILHTTVGSVGNLGVQSMTAGTDVRIPSGIGQWSTILRPIPVIASNKDKEGFIHVGGEIGCIAVLMENDNIRAEHVARGHLAFDETVGRILRDELAKITIRNRELKVDDSMKKRVEDAVNSAVTSGFGLWDWISAAVNKDDIIAYEFFRFPYAELEQHGAISLERRYSTKSDGDWSLYGSVVARKTGGPGKNSTCIIL